MSETKVESDAALEQSVLRIGARSIGVHWPCFIVAEMSANHRNDFNHAVRILEHAKEAGADAVKVQTYTADTLTIPCDNAFFRIEGTLWAGRTLHDLYQEAHMPWEWQPKLKEIAEQLGLIFFSTPFDETSVDFLESLGMPVHKVASFELVDIPLLRKIGSTRKPVIMSTGMATLGEIDDAVKALREAGCPQLALLKCTSAYPSPPDEMNLRTIPHMAEAFGCTVGLSDHTLSSAVPVAAVALGASIVEKHFTLRRSDGGADAAFSLEPREFKSMVEAVRETEKALGKIKYEPTELEAASRVFRRSLFVVKDIKAGEGVTRENVRSIRPGNGMAPKYLGEVVGRRAASDIAAGTPLAWSLLQ